MGFNNRGRRGLSSDVVAHVERLLARDEVLTNRQIAARAGCSYLTVWRIRTGRHRTQQDEDRRGGRPARVRLALELLAREPQPPINRVARLLNMHRRAVRSLARGEHITQKGRTA